MSTTSTMVIKDEKMPAIENVVCIGLKQEFDGELLIKLVRPVGGHSTMMEVELYLRHADLSDGGIELKLEDCLNLQSLPAVLIDTKNLADMLDMTNEDATELIYEQVVARHAELVIKQIRSKDEILFTLSIGTYCSETELPVSQFIPFLKAP